MSGNLIEGIKQRLYAFLEKKKFKILSEVYNENTVINRQGAIEITFTNLGEPCKVDTFTLNTGGFLSVSANSNEENVTEDWDVVWPTSATNKNLVVARKIYVN